MLLQIPTTVATVSSWANYFKDLVHWPPQGTSDAGELIVVVTTLFLSFGIMVAFGQWWQR